MNKFGDTRLSDGKLNVRGPFTTDSGEEVRHLHFMVSQGDVMVDGHAEVSDGEWSGSVPAGDIQAGPANGAATGIVRDSSSRPGLVTISWVEPITISR